MKSKKFFLCFCLSISFCFLLSQHAQAAFEYKLLEQFPGFFNAGSSPSFPDLLSAIYKFFIWTVGIAAFFMLTVGGFLYVTSAGNNASITTAKNIITDAIIGLVAVLTAYILLYVINPDLVKLNLNLISVEVNTASMPNAAEGPVKFSDGNDNSVAKGQVLDAAEKLKNSGCRYCNPKYGCSRNGCKGNPPYTDCSNFVENAYKNAGCKSPGGSTGQMASRTKGCVPQSSLHTGDAVVIRSPSSFSGGHVFICKNEGCTVKIHAAGTKTGLVNGNVTSKDMANCKGVIRASDYCK